MTNKTRKNIEKICLAGIIGGLFFLSVEKGLDYYKNKKNITEHKSVTLGILNAIGLACIGYSLSLKRYKKEY